jgi:hypothetical protein
MTTKKHADTFDVKCKARTFTLKVPSGFEIIGADRSAKDVMAMPAYRMATAIVAVDGKTVSPATNDLDLSARLQELKASESDKLLQALGEHFATVHCRKFELREMNGLQQARADRLSGEPITVASYRAIASVVSIDGHAVKPFEKDEDLDARLREVNAPELNAIISEYMAISSDISDEELGKGFVPTESPPTS